MGRSKTIEQKMQDNAEFRKYMDQLFQDSEAQENKIQVEIDAVVKKLYDGNKWQYSRLFGGKSSDYQNYDDWSLDRINSIINSIGNAIKGGDFPSDKVPGSKTADESTVNEAKEFLSSFNSDYGLIISRIQSLISGILSQFAVASDATRKTELKDLPLSGGMHLFFGSSGEVFSNQTFFTNQFFTSFQIVFEVCMSVEEARAISLVGILKTTQQEIQSANDMILLIRAKQAASLRSILKTKPETFVATKAVYDRMLHSYQNDIDKLVASYNKYISVVNAVDALYSGGAPLKGALVDAADEKDVKYADLPLNFMFNEWEEVIARRYISEKENNPV